MWPHGVWHQVLAGLVFAAGVVAIRAAPIVSVFLCQSRVSKAQRAGAAAAYFGIAWCAFSNGYIDIPWTVSAFGYFLIASWAFYQALDAIASPWIAAILSGLVFFLAPMVLLGSRSAAFGALGWELALSAYSYYREFNREQRQSSLRECVHFLLVNPALAFPKRGRIVSPPGIHGDGLLRVLQGAAMTALALGLLPLIRARFGHFERRAPLMLSGIFWFAGVYLTQVGLGDIQVGLMRQLGHEVPERYLKPLRSETPADFWRRWNTYLGDWARIYVFAPAARRLSRTGRGFRLPHTAAVGLAAIVTFAVIGILHDVYAFETWPPVRTAGMVWFSSVGAIVVLWRVAEQSLRGPVARPMGTLPRMLRRSVFLVLALGAAVCAPHGGLVR